MQVHHRSANGHGQSVQHPRRQRVGVHPEAAGPRRERLAQHLRRRHGIQWVQRSFCSGLSRSFRQISIPVLPVSVSYFINSTRPFSTALFPSAHQSAWVLLSYLRLFSKFHVVGLLSVTEPIKSLNPKATTDLRRKRYGSFVVLKTCSGQNCVNFLFLHGNVSSSLCRMKFSHSLSVPFSVGGGA